MGRLDPAVLSVCCPRSLKKRWFLCGCLLAAGAMFKGQLLLRCAFFCALADLGKRDGCAHCDCSRGLRRRRPLVVSPWLLRTPTALIVVALVGGVSSLIFFGRKFRHPWAWVAGMIALGTFVAERSLAAALHGCELVFSTAASIIHISSSARATTCHSFSDVSVGR